MMIVSRVGNKLQIKFLKFHYLGCLSGQGVTARSLEYRLLAYSKGRIRWFLMDMSWIYVKCFLYFQLTLFKRLYACCEVKDAEQDIINNPELLVSQLDPIVF